MIVVWIIVAILIGVGIRQLAGFIAVEFLMKPVLLIARWGAALLVAIVGWGRRSPLLPCFPCLNPDFHD